MDLAEFAALSSLLGTLGEECHGRSRMNGFWESQDYSEPGATLEVAAKIALISGEAHELLEAWREPDPFAPCAKDDRLSMVAEEMADVLIRLLDLAHFLDVDLAHATRIKLGVNAGRVYKHGKRF